jgi:hypothetical protein
LLICAPRCCLQMSEGRPNVAAIHSFFMEANIMALKVLYRGTWFRTKKSQDADIQFTWELFLHS